MNESPSVLAVGAHPDDIEFMMAGTLMMLGRAGWRMHYLNIANGCMGTATLPPDVAAATRRAESMAACEHIGAEYYESIVDDLHIFHTNEVIGPVVAVVRKIRPRIMLVHSNVDYMEDHTYACRVAVTAAFARALINYPVPPDSPEPFGGDVTLYHAMPYGLRGPFRERVHPGQYVDVTDTIEDKRAMLACHKSQKEWLDHSQGLDAYLDTMTEFAWDVGKMSGRFEYAEGWRRRLHAGYSQEDDDPLREALGDACLIDEDYERALDA